jgi:hypothetical protein
VVLRLVTDNDQPDGTLYCRHSAGCRRPATILVSFLGKPYLPSCDDCARSTYDMFPDQTAFAPLAEFVDMFEAAKQAALATPEQVAESLVSKAYRAICLRTIRDRKLYCQEYWCCQAYSQSEQLTAADAATEVIGHHTPLLSCIDCLHKRQEDRGYDQVKVYQLTQSFIAKYWKLIDEGEASKILAGSYQGTPQQGNLVPWYQHPDVINAAIVGGVAIAAHEATKRHKARLRDSALGRAPLNNTAAGMRYGTYLAGRPDDTQEGIQYELQQLNTANPKWTRR